MGETYRKAKISQTTVDKAQPEAARYVITDTEIPGFWLTVSPSGRKAFSLRYRVGGGRGATVRQPKIGEWPAMKAEKARAIAQDWAADVRLGGDPGGARLAYREAPTMAALFTRFLADHAERHKKASSIANDRRLIEKRLLPVFGAKKVLEVTRADVSRFHKSLADTPYEANRALALLSKAFNLAEVWDMRKDGTNPCRHVSKFAETKRKRFLSPLELAKLGQALREAERNGSVLLPAQPGIRTEAMRVPVNSGAVAAIRLLVLTGARKGEILGLQWNWIDMTNGRASLPDSKTGEKVLILPPPALAVLAAHPRVEGNPHVIAGGKPGTALVNLKDPWLAIREAAGLEGVRIHDLRHSFASVGAAGGASLPIIGALLGHTQASTTQRYAHLHDDPLQAAAASIGGRIAAAMGVTSGNGEVTRFNR